MKKYFRILLIAVLAAVMVFAAVPAFAEEPAVDISIDTPITMSEIYATEMKNENGESVRMFWDWAMYGTFTATVDGVVYENITGQQFEEILRNTKYSAKWQEVDEQSPEAPWTVGQSNSCVLHVDSPT